MKILIVSATKDEIRGIIEEFTLVKENNDRLTHYSRGTMMVDVLITGPGMTLTAFWMGKALRSYYDIALNLGLAGSYDRNTFALGTVCRVTEDTFADIGAEDDNKFLTAVQLGLLNEEEYSIKNLWPVDIQALKQLPEARGITVNKVHGSTSSILQTENLFHPDVETMEGAAFLYACGQHLMPCCQLRAISNYVETRNKDNWNVPLAVENLHNTALTVINDAGNRS